MLFTRSADASEGSLAELLNAGPSATANDRRLRTFQDSGACAIPFTTGRKLRLSASYKGASRVTLSISYRAESGCWSRWTDDTLKAPASAEWARATWNLPDPPAGTKALAIGAVAFDPGVTSFDAFALEDIVP